MNKFSTTVTKWLIKNKAISIDDKENYEYAVFCFLITFLPLLIVIIIGSVFGVLLEAVIFIIPFMLLRKFSGGFHLKSALMCMFFSTTFLILAIRLTNMLIYAEYIPVITFLILLSICILIKNSPIDSVERNLGANEKKVYKKVVIYITISLLIIYLSLIYTRVFYIAVPLGCGIITTALLQIPCIIKIKYLKHQWL